MSQTSQLTLTSQTRTIILTPNTVRKSKLLLKNTLKNLRRSKLGHLFKRPEEITPDQEEHALLIGTKKSMSPGLRMMRAIFVSWPKQIRLFALSFVRTRAVLHNVFNVVRHAIPTSYKMEGPSQIIPLCQWYRHCLHFGIVDYVEN